MKRFVSILTALSIVCVLIAAPSSASSAYPSTPAESADPTAAIVGIYAGFYSEAHFMLRSDGSLWAWGQNNSRQLGVRADRDLTDIPESSSKAVKVMDGVKDVSAGMKHTLIVNTDGTLWGCGSNDYSQLGRSAESSHKAPIKIMEGVRQASAGAWHSLVVKEDSSLWSFGCNGCGQLGTGNTQSSGEPQRIMEDVRCAQAGGEYSLAVKEDGTLWAWGDNQSAQLGDGTRVSISTPKKIMDGVILAATSVNGEVSKSKSKKNGFTYYIPGYSVGMGKKRKYMPGRWVSSSSFSVTTTYSNFSASTSYAVKNDGALWAWGANNHGQMGVRQRGTVVTPVQIMSDVSTLSAGEGYALAVKKDGSLWICGDIELSEERSFGHDGTLKRPSYWCNAQTNRPLNRAKVQTIWPRKAMEDVCAVAGGRESILLLKKDGRLYEFYQNPNTVYTFEFKASTNLGLIPKIENVQ